MRPRGFPWCNSEFPEAAKQPTVFATAAALAVTKAQRFGMGACTPRVEPAPAHAPMRTHQRALQV